MLAFKLSQAHKISVQFSCRSCSQYLGNCHLLAGSIIMYPVGNDKQMRKNKTEKNRVQNIAVEYKKLEQLLSRVYGKKRKLNSKVKILKCTYEFLLGQQSLSVSTICIYKCKAESNYYCIIADSSEYCC